MKSLGTKSKSYKVENPALLGIEKFRRTDNPTGRTIG